MPWRATPERIPAHDRCIEYWTAYGHTIIEADSNPDKPFNRAQARNNAVAQADTDIIILADADTLPVHHTQITTAINLAAKTGGAVWPYSRYLLLPHDAVTRHILSTITPVREWPTKWRPGGLTVITRHAYQEIGGYDETFGAGWGFEDGAFHLAAQTLLPVQHLPGVAYAFDHPGARRRDPRNRRKYWWYNRAKNNPAEMRRLTTRSTNDAATHRDSGAPR